MEKKELEDRILNSDLRNKVVAAEQAAKLIQSGMIIGTSGFTMDGYPKSVPSALAAESQSGKRLSLTLITGASVGEELDGALAKAGFIARRYSYQSSRTLREDINSGKVPYVDFHLSQVPYWIRNEYFGKLDLALIECIKINEDGSLVPGTSVGISDVLAECAEKVIVEINTSKPLSLEGLHDIYTPARFPHTQPIPVTKAAERIGRAAIPCRPEKISAIVFTDRKDPLSPLPAPDRASDQISAHTIDFLKKELACGRFNGRIPPLQSGVGNVANAVLQGLLKSDLSGLEFYSEVLQESVLDLIDAEKVLCASGTAVTMSQERRPDFYSRIEHYKRHLVLRPQEISNSPEVIHRLGVIAMNTALEADFSGNVNSTHISGTRMMNGIGGSGDYARNAMLTIFSTPSTAMGGSVSCIVPHVTHVDHTEHDVDVLITEWGVADLRGLTAYERAPIVIQNCAHPKFRPWLFKELERIKSNSYYCHGIPFQIRKEVDYIKENQI